MPGIKPHLKPKWVPITPKQLLKLQRPVTIYKRNGTELIVARKSVGTVFPADRSSPLDLVKSAPHIVWYKTADTEMMTELKGIDKEMDEEFQHLQGVRPRPPINASTYEFEWPFYARAVIDHFLSCLHTRPPRITKDEDGSLERPFDLKRAQVDEYLANLRKNWRERTPYNTGVEQMSSSELKQWICRTRKLAEKDKLSKRARSGARGRLAKGSAKQDTPDEEESEAEVEGEEEDEEDEEADEREKATNMDMGLEGSIQFALKTLLSEQITVDSSLFGSKWSNATQVIARKTIQALVGNREEVRMQFEALERMWEAPSPKNNERAPARGKVVENKPTASKGGSEVAGRNKRKREGAISIGERSSSRLANHTKRKKHDHTPEEMNQNPDANPSIPLNSSVSVNRPAFSDPLMSTNPPTNLDKLQQPPSIDQPIDVDDQMQYDGSEAEMDMLIVKRDVQERTGRVVEQPDPSSETEVEELLGDS